MVNLCPANPIIGPEGETNLNIVDMIAVPGRAEKLVAESQDQKVLDHLLTQVVVNAEDLLFPPIRLQGFL